MGNYFFEVSDFNISYNENGESRRSRNGTLHSDKTGKDYRTFNIKIDDVDKNQHDNLFYLIYKCHNQGSNLQFVDIYDNTYTIKIPINGFDFTPQEGKEEYYNWDLTLEEVV